MPASWLEQKLAQNGLTLADLSKQTDLPLQTLEELSKTEKGTSPEWNLVLSTINSYPALYAPSQDLPALLESRMQSEGDDAQCIVYYGVNQSDLLFVACRFDDGTLHGANVDVTNLKHFPLTLRQAYDLFSAQLMSQTNAALASR